MTREDIIRMAREAGFDDWAVYGRLESKEDCLEHFAKLVYEHTWKEAGIAATRTVIDAAVLAEREACAKVCESKMPNPVKNWADAQIVNALKDCSAAIRARNT